jgi:hypothetical protein
LEIRMENEVELVIGGCGLGIRKEFARLGVKREDWRVSGSLGFRLGAGDWSLGIVRRVIRLGVEN